MYFKYGPYRHAKDEVQISSFSARANFRRGRRAGTTRQISITGEILATGQSNITAKIREIERAYSTDGYDAGLYQDDGRLTPHALSSAGSISGVRVASFQWLPTLGGYATSTLRYQITLEADYLDGGAPQIVSYSETLAFLGAGGPLYTYVEPQVGPAIRQVVQQRTLFRAQQSGQAVGMLGYPAVNPPLWPQWEQQEQRRLQHSAPQNERGFYENYTVSWSYSFVSPFPLTGIARIR